MKNYQDSQEAKNGNNNDDFDRTILCTHGWLDNCGTHYYLAPRLLERIMDLDPHHYHHGTTEIIAMDFPGHGHSSHWSKDAPPLVSADLVFYTCEAIRQLLSSSQQPSSPRNDMKTKQKKKITLLGHSLGAGVVSLTAAAFPEWVDQVILLDAATFLPRQAKDTAKHVQQHILRRQEERHNQQQQSPPSPRIYPNLERAIQVRRLSATKMPGNQTLSYEAARAMVMRGTKSVDGQPFGETKEGGSARDEGPAAVQFRHDPRFTWPSIQYMTWEQNEGILEALHKTGIDVCLIQADAGWPVDDHIMNRVAEVLQPKFFRKLPGKHHFHADPETAEAVCDAVIEFLRQ